MDKKTNNWQIKKLGEVFIIERGGSPRPIEEYITDDENGINWIKIGDTKGVTKYITKTNEKIKPEGLKKTRMVYEDDFILSNSMSFGRPYIMKTNGCIHDGWLVIRKNENVDNNYLYYVLTSNQVYVQFSTLAKGSTVKNLNIAAVKEVEIPLPPLETQHAIVSKIEELFSELDKGIAELKTAQQQLKTYRQSVLNSIVNDKNLNSIESVIEKLDQGWSPKCLNEKSKSFNEWAVIKTSAVQFGRFNPDENKILPKNVPPKEQHEILAGDILITRAGPRVRVGVCCLVKKTRRRLINCDKVYRIKVRKEIILPEFFELILNTPFYQDEIEVMKSGISDSGLNLTQSKFLKIKIPLPPIEEQHRIVQEIESRLSVADKMEQSIQESLQKAEALRQSILKKAFCGELV